ncbi:hypothetical protein HNO88_004238 [Novosphingobium chloroacetimidivorans]|uniref:Glycosyltransferase RgtA/B/C/D-like domain-containing protein n=1 Tax=Novosphingobium chloroacetimidivorans TaxID=1428314 RepID=A0A7W7KDM4_9SPHN|nr:hypothetical protein [Novosphingobium chloroacetimidivorans]MBB4860892.1 hypothetical protein [Novosphingobium chloroacetimidivorans]
MTALAGPHGMVFARRVGLPIAWREFAILAAVFVIQIPLVLNSDLGWLLTVCEKMLAGGRLGIDAIELNPPLSVLMYMPAAYLGSVLPVPAHVFVVAMVLVLAWCSTRLTLAALHPILADDTARRCATQVILTALALVPGATFAQREHVAVLGLVPLVAFAASFAMGDTQTRALSLRILVGLCAGFAMCIKPHFALPAALSLLWAAYRQRSIKLLFDITCWVAGAMVVGYYVAALIAYPAYFSVYPRWAALTYLPVRKPLSFLLFGPDVLCALAGLLWMLHITCGRERTRWGDGAPWLLAALGGFLSYVIQGKGFGYMRLPAATFALLGPLLTPAFLTGRLPPADQRKVLLAGLALVIWLVPSPNSFIVLQEPIRAAAPAHPRILMVSDNVGLGEPLVRKLNGEWASAAGSQLLSGGAEMQLERGGLSATDHQLAEEIITMERTRLREDLKRRRPDVLLIDSKRFGWPFDWNAWARADPAIAHELDNNYRFLTRRKGVAIWVRQGRVGASRS